MEFRDLRRQYIENKAAMDNAINRVICSGVFIGGKYVEEFEQRLADYIGVKECITCANGTDALQLALMAWGVKEGDAVFVPDFTFFSSGEVVPLVGATPIFADIDEVSYNISCEDLESRIKWVLEHTDLQPRVVVSVDLFGNPADYETLRQIANKYDMYILEDGAQGFGGQIGNRKTCSFGDISTTSFFPAKPLGCYGDGGAIFTDNTEWASLLRSYKVHGKGEDKYDNVRVGLNSRLDAIQAAILIEKLTFLDDELRRCDEVAKWYQRELSDCEDIITPTIRDDCKSAWAQYTILLPNEQIRERVMDSLRKEDIPTMIYYRKPMHEQKAFIGIAPQLKDYPVATEVCKRCLSLPMSAYISEMDVIKIGNILQETCN